MSIYTEEEARTKWCPFARTTFMCSPDEWEAGRATMEQVGIIPERCIASECMAWRTITQRMQLSPEMRPTKKGWEKHGEPVDLGNGAQQHWQREAGYCGLAGKAQP